MAENTKIEWADATANVIDGKAMVQIGKKRAGRLLDGVEHNAFPEVR